jgi:hypothetical protein
MLKHKRKILRKGVCSQALEREREKLDMQTSTLGKAGTIAF